MKKTLMHTQYGWKGHSSFISTMNFSIFCSLFLRLLPTFKLFSSNKFLPTVFLSNSTFLIDFPAMRLMVTIPPSLSLDLFLWSTFFPLASSLSRSHTSLAPVIPWVAEDTIHWMCVCDDHTLKKGMCLGRGDEFSHLIPFLRLGPALRLCRQKIRWKCNHNQLRAQTKRDTHMHTHATHAQTYSLAHYRKGAMQKIVLDMAMRKGARDVVMGWGGGFLIYIFNVKYHSKRES